LLEPADVTRIPAALGVAGDPVTQAGGCGGAGSAPLPQPSLFGAESERRMLPQDVKTAADAMKIVEERGISHVKVGVFDADGVMRGKYISKQKFASALESGFGFCDVVLGWDSNDQLYDNVNFTGWHTAFPDAPVRILPETCREIPFEPNTLLFLCEFAGKAEELCPRGILRRAIEKARAMGFEPYAALEYEFFLFDETPHTVREKGYRNLKNITPGFYGYSMLLRVDLSKAKIGCFCGYGRAALFRQLSIKLRCFIELAVAFLCLRQGELRERRNFRDTAIREFTQLADSLGPVEKQSVRSNEVTGF
jgi:hypothetical protein